MIMRRIVKGVLQLDLSNLLVLENTFSCGQSFRWHLVGENTWRGVLGSQIFTLKQEELSEISYEIFFSADESQAMKCLIDYFNLNSSETLEQLYKNWSNSESKDDINSTFKSVSKQIVGLRLLRQDPYETTLSFICSQNNNIGRITKMIDKLCQRYGSYLEQIDGIKYYSFPTIKQLLLASDADLRELGFGYRSKYIVGAVQKVHQNGGEEWLRNLRSLEYDQIRQSLMSLPGVGPKVADCVSLFSMDKFDLVPVDTHVWQMAKRYIPALPDIKNPSPKHFSVVKEYFKNKFGPKAGWAHTILFAAELAPFKKKILKDLVIDSKEANLVVKN